MATKAERRGVDGVLVLDKPLGLTSNAALQRAKRLLRAEKAGHTGTLDPLATGVLPICFGAATKLSQFALDADKRYLATLRFGITTTTGDAEGEVVRSEPASVSREALVAACARFVGTTSQVPPMHSALKKDGKPLYAYARAGLAVERAAREVEIRSLDVVDGAVDTWTIDVVCSKGTYVRTLAEDIGSAIGCGASLIALRRTATGGIAIDGAVSLEALEATPEGSRISFLRPADCLVADRPSIRLGPDDAGRFLAGMRRRVEADDAPCVRVYASDPAAFLGIAHIRGGELISTRLLSPAEIGRVATSERAASEPHASAFAATHP